MAVREQDTVRRARILVVDDERTKCETLCYLLEGEGYQVDRACSADQAVTKMVQHRFELVLVDLGMPGTDDLDMLRRMQEADRDAVVIVMASYSSLKSALRALKYGASDYLSNALDDPDTVLAAVQRGLQELRRPLSRIPIPSF